MFLWFWTLIMLDATGLTSPVDPTLFDEAPARITAPAKPAAPNSPTRVTSPGAPDRVAEPTNPSYKSEPQTPSGRFTTAIEVKPILTATKSSWVGVREYDGQDLVYVTQIMAWRCGLAGMKFAINDAPLADWPLPPCHIDSAAPNALTPEDGLPYRAYPLGSVRTVTIELIYDDLSFDSGVFLRDLVKIP